MALVWEHTDDGLDSGSLDEDDEKYSSFGYNLKVELT